MESSAFFVATQLEMPVSAVERGVSLCDAKPACKGLSLEPWPALTNHDN